MALTLSQSKTALAINLTASFLGVGGTGPYVYSVIAGGAGGTIDSSTGIYTAPATVSENPLLLFDTVQVTDATSAVATSQIMVGDALLLFCEIIQSEMGLAAGRVFIWDQKIFQPSDDGLYVIVSETNLRAFGNSIAPDPILGWSNPIQFVNMQSTLNVDIISRGQDARVLKEQVVLAFNSIYSQSQQEGNSFYIGKLPPGAGFINLSLVDGAAIPYRYRISVNIQYAVTKTKAVPYFDTFENVTIATNQ